MSVIAKMRRQKAVWWARGTKDRFGRYTFLEPVEVACRWDDTVLNFVNSQGEEQASKAVVYVDRVISVGDRLKRGELDSNTPDDPLSITDSYEVRRLDQTPNFKATETLYTAYL